MESRNMLAYAKAVVAAAYSAAELERCDEVLVHLGHLEAKLAAALAAPSPPALTDGETPPLLTDDEIDAIAAEHRAGKLMYVWPHAMARAVEAEVRRRVRAKG